MRLPCTLVALTVAVAAGATAEQPLTFFISTGDRLTGFRDGDRDLASWAFETWVRESQGSLSLQPSPEDRALVRLYWVPLNDTTFGEMRRLMVGDRPGAAVYVRADLEALGADIAGRAKQDPLWRDTIVFLTCVHEIGHAFGLPHTANDRDIMYSFGYGGDIIEYFMRYRRKLKVRADMRTVSALSVADVRHLRALHPAP